MAVGTERKKPEANILERHLHGQFHATWPLERINRERQWWRRYPRNPYHRTSASLWASRSTDTTRQLRVRSCLLGSTFVRLKLVLFNSPINTAGHSQRTVTYDRSLPSHANAVTGSRAGTRGETSTRAKRSLPTPSTSRRAMDSGPAFRQKLREMQRQSLASSLELPSFGIDTVGRESTGPV